MTKSKDKSIGSVIKQYRVLKNMTQEELAEKLDLSYQQVQKYEYNKAVPPLDKLVQLSKNLEIPIEVFFKENLRQDLIHKIETEISKNYEVIDLMKKSPELLEALKYYSKNKSNLTAFNIIEFFKTLNKIPKDKRVLFIKLLEDISAIF